jgi:hypothetical protein
MISVAWLMWESQAGISCLNPFHFYVSISSEQNTITSQSTPPQLSTIIQITQATVGYSSNREYHHYKLLHKVLA